MTDKLEMPYHQELRDPVTVAIKRYKARIEELEAEIEKLGSKYKASMDVLQETTNNWHDALDQIEKLKEQTKLYFHAFNKAAERLKEAGLGDN